MGNTYVLVLEINYTIFFALLLFFLAIRLCFTFLWPIFSTRKMGWTMPLGHFYSHQSLCSNVLMHHFQIPWILTKSGVDFANLTTAIVNKCMSFILFLSSSWCNCNIYYRIWPFHTLLDIAELQTLLRLLFSYSPITRWQSSLFELFHHIFIFVVVSIGVTPGYPYRDLTDFFSLFFVRILHLIVAIVPHLRR